MIDSEKDVSQFKWFFSEGYWDIIRPDFVSGEEDPEDNRCDEPADCIPVSFKIKKPREPWTYRKFFATETWDTLKIGFRNGERDPEEYRCGEGALECIPLKFSINADKGSNQYKKFYSAEIWAETKPLLDDGADPEDYRCEEALNCIPLTYEIDADKSVNQYTWFFSADEWKSTRKTL